MSIAPPAPVTDPALLTKRTLREALQKRGLRLDRVCPLTSSQFVEVEVSHPDHDLVVVQRITRRQMADQNFDRIVDDLVKQTWKAIQGGGSV